MNWFYAKEGQQAGPVDDAELDRLVTTGDIADSTLVWHSGLTNWQPYAAVRTGAQAGGVATLSAPAGQAQCSQCGRILPADEVVRIDNLDVCAECKPALIQRLREGAPISSAVLSAPVYAGFWIRLGAAILDGLILIPFYIVVGIAFYFLTDLRNLDFAHVQPQEITKISRGFLPLSIGVQFILACYSAFCINRFGGTPGKRICGLRVVHGNAGTRVSFLRGLGRFAAKMVPRTIPGLLSGFLPQQLLLPLVYIYPLTDSLFIVFDGQKRALHDMICDTRVLLERR